MATPNAEKMRRLVARGAAMPTPADDDRPGRFPITDEESLRNAIRAVGRVKPNTDEARAKVRRHVMARAAALDLERLIPSAWNADGSLKTN